MDSDLESMERPRTLYCNNLPPPTFPCERLCDACIDVANLDVKIAKAKQVLADLDAERRQLLSKVNHVHDTITDRIPLEIFTEILQQSLPHTESPHITSDPLQRLGPLVFTAVSRRWREIVCSIPSLWSVVPIVLGTKHNLSRADILEQWLRHSGQTLLTIIVNFHPLYLSESLRPSARIISEHSNHLESIRVEGPVEFLQYLDFSGQGARVLSDIHLSLLYVPYSIMPSTEMITFGNFKLRPTNLRLNDVSLAQLNICVSHLTHFSAVEIPADDFSFLLGHAPSLVNVTAQRIYGHMDPITKSTYQPALMSLCIGYASDQIICALADSMLSPALRKLEYGLTPPFSSEIPLVPTLNSIAGYIQRSSALLESFLLTGLSLSTANSDTYCALTRLWGVIGPQVTHLTLKEISEVNWGTPETVQQLVDCLFPQPQSFPNLQRLTIGSVDQCWLSLLNRLLRASNSTDRPTPIQIVMYTYFSPVHIDSGPYTTPHIHWAGMTESFSQADIAEILSLKEKLGVSIKMPNSYDHGHPPDRSDVFPAVFDALTAFILEPGIEAQAVVS